MTRVVKRNAKKRGTNADTVEQRKLVWVQLKKFIKGKEEQKREMKEKLIEARRKLKKMTRDGKRKYWEGKWKKVGKIKNLMKI